MMYFPFSGSSGFCIILVHRATCKGCSSFIRCRSLSKSHRFGGARPMSLSLTPILSLTRFETSLISSSTFFKVRAYGPWPYVFSSWMSPSSSGLISLLAFGSSSSANCFSKPPVFSQSIEDKVSIHNHSLGIRTLFGRHFQKGDSLIKSPRQAA